MATTTVKISKEDQTKQKNQLYRDTHKEQTKEYNRTYYDARKEIISQNTKVKMQCQCGSVFRASSIARHLKTGKHQRYIANQPTTTE